MLILSASVCFLAISVLSLFVVVRALRRGHEIVRIEVGVISHRASKDYSEFLEHKGDTSTRATNQAIWLQEIEHRLVKLEPKPKGKKKPVVVKGLNDFSYTGPKGRRGTK